MLKIYYSIENGGDGSAYPVWFTTTGCITIEGASVLVKDQYGEVAIDAVAYCKELKSRLWGDKASNEEGFTMCKEFVEEFFKDET